MKRRGQMKLSFGMIFSIILIIVFFAFGFFVIMKFLDMKGSVEAGKFVEDFQNDIDKMWLGQGSQVEEYYVPSKVEAVCIADYSSSAKGTYSNRYKKLKQVLYGDENIFFYPVGSGNGLDSTIMEHLDIDKITQEDNPFCIDSLEGKINITIEKNFEDNLVVIE